jgi:HSP20 family protein
LSSVTPWRRSQNPGASRAGRTVTTGGERKAKRGEKDVDFHYKEITCGSFERIFSLPEGVDTGKCKADYRNGVLELMAPVAAARPPRRIPANTAPMSKRIAA